MARQRSRGLPALLEGVAWTLGIAFVALLGLTAGEAGASAPTRGAEGCVACHAGIEAMHPEAALTCTDCHGGDGAAKTKAEAHPQRARAEAGDERVAGPMEDLTWRRFENPMDLRVAATTCGGCHEREVARVRTSLHATTAGHLSDGFYEAGLIPKKGSQYGVFAVPAGQAEPGDVTQLYQVPPFRESGAKDSLATHYADLARKECMQCHLWSEGRAVEGRVGFDGDYRGEGCAACHVPYALDGLSESADRTARRAEPGHPRMHSMTRAPTTDTCTSCHYGDASIGLNFRGLSQLPPGAPGGPQIPGTTDVLRNRQFYLDDPAIVPPDVHHERGMHCIDCHTVNDVMGDGHLYGAMELAVEISCSDCHGTFTKPATLRTERGTPLSHLRRKGSEVVLTSKVDGKEHVVPQVVHVLDRKRPEYNERAAKAMTSDHGELECYLCHSGWNPNFMGFHFDRNESLTQLDLLSGQRTKGRVTTQEKVFATWKSFYAGRNESGRFAPYLTGFSTMGTVRDEEGRVVLDQVLPVTAAGLSGLTQVHHQMHTVRPTARACVECHRSSATWGMGSTNFRLGRQLAFVGDRRGVEVLAIDRAQISASVPLAKFVLPDIVDLALECDPLQARAQRLYVAEGFRGVHVLDVSNPIEPKRLQFLATVQPRGLVLAGEHLYVADGAGGLRVMKRSADGRLTQVAHVPTFDARDVTVQWPYAYVADGPGGVLVVDIRKPSEPRLVGGTRVSSDEGARDAATTVTLLFQNSRPLAPEGVIADRRSPARALLCVLDEREGLVLLDANEPTALAKLWPPIDERSRAVRRNGTFRGLVVRSHVDLAEQQGGSKTREGDFAYVLVEGEGGNGPTSRVQVLEITEPRRVKNIAQLESGDATEMLAAGAFYNAPFLQPVLFAPGSDGVVLTDVGISGEPRQLGSIVGLKESYVVAIEEFPLDRMLDETGRPLKDTSHANSRWLTLAEIDRLLLVPGSVLGTLEGAARTEAPGAGARQHFAACDADRSGVLDGTELERAGATLDVDRDGRIVMAELAPLAGLVLEVRSDAEPEEGPRFLETRVDRDGDLARLFDGVAPLAFDADGNRRLDRPELSRALFAALDLDGDKLLDLDELSRHPGDLRQLRYRGPFAARRFKELDLNGDGRIQPKELKVAAADFDALDVDRNGTVDLGPAGNAFWEARGYFARQGEWPSRRAYVAQLSPRTSVDELLATFDVDKDMLLTARELKKRPDLFLELDLNRDGTADATELAQRIRTVDGQGVDGVPDSFLDRWDLDGNGKVDPVELPAAAKRALGVQ